MLRRDVKLGDIPFLRLTCRLLCMSVVHRHVFAAVTEHPLDELRRCSALG